ncbi:MAG: GWxTD domain-containing protein [Ignavibacteriaceae bacterium]|nr:GWxTD domain-containing protein [Ignavibacteriaceae bacterium]
MKKLIAILFFSFLSLPLWGQKFEFESPLLYEYYYSQPDSGNGIFQFAYRINYDELTFLKDGERYTTRIRITLELQDSSTNNISRANEDKVVTVSEFDETISKNKSVQGLLNVNLEKKKYFLSITLTDLLTNKDFTIPKFSIDLALHQPKSYIVSLGGNGKYYLANKRKTIPFSPNAYSFIYEPVSPLVRSDSLSLKFQSHTDFLSFYSNSTIENAFLLEEDSLGIYLDPQKKSPGRNFLFKDVSLKLPEGKFTIKENKNQQSFLEVKWWDKPHSLLNYEISLKALGIIEPKSVIDSLKNDSGKFGYKNFFKYWQKYDPTPNSTYNDLMAEFYSRTDYAQKTFSNFTTPDGILTDRGKIYIQFGPPTSTERTSSLNGRNLEIWFYKERNKKYYFRDRAGNGNYELVKE